jgi:hypothetical protein
MHYFLASSARSQAKVHKKWMGILAYYLFVLAHRQTYRHAIHGCVGHEQLHHTSGVGSPLVSAGLCLVLAGMVLDQSTK